MQGCFPLYRCHRSGVVHIRARSKHSELISEWLHLPLIYLPRPPEVHNNQMKAATCPSKRHRGASISFLFLGATCILRQRTKLLPTAPSEESDPGLGHDHHVGSHASTRSDTSRNDLLFGLSNPSTQNGTGRTGGRDTASDEIFSAKKISYTSVSPLSS